MIVFLAGCDQKIANIKETTIDICKFSEEANNVYDNNVSDSLLKRQFSELGLVVPKNKHIVIVQAKWSCHICRDMIDKFIYENYQSNLFTYILPSLSNKELGFIFSDVILSSRSFVVDREDFATKLGLVWNNSKIYYLESGKVQKEIAITVQNVDHELNIKTIMKHFKTIHKKEKSNTIYIK